MKSKIEDFFLGMAMWVVFGIIAAFALGFYWMIIFPLSLGTGRPDEYRF